MDDPGDFEAEIRLIDELCFNSTIPGDLAKELDREPADAVVLDCMLARNTSQPAAVDISCGRAR